MRAGRKYAKERGGGWGGHTESARESERASEKDRERERERERERGREGGEGRATWCRRQRSQRGRRRGGALAGSTAH
eukprot:2503222-Rhodomonas_salina.2